MISVLLATYNGEKYLSTAIESVLNQTFNNFEILIGLNGTTDDSKNLIKKYNDSRIRIFDYGDDKGKAKTLNRLLVEAKYDWIALQDDDDVWLQDKLENQIKFLEDFDVIGTFISYIDSYGNMIGAPTLYSHHEEIKKYSLNGTNQVANTSAIFKKADALEIYGWNPEIDGIEDFDFWLKLLRKDKKFFNIPECYVLHRIHKSNFNTKQYDLSKIL